MARGDLDDLAARLKREGFNYLGDPELQELINQAVEELGYDRQWPDRLAIVTLVPPVADVNGIDRVLSVIDDASGSPLEEVTREELRRLTPALSTPGSPRYWYFDQLGRIACWPAPATTVTIDYLSRKLWSAGGLAAQNGADVPLLPMGARSAAVQLAAAKAHEENGAVDLGGQKRSVADLMAERAYATVARRITQRRVRVVD